TTLSQSGWSGRCAAVVIKPELEMWVWSDSPHVSKALGWENRQPSVYDWIKANKAFWPDNTDKPSRPKEALESSLRVVRKSSSPSIFETLAKHVSVTRCTDRAFGKFKTVLKQWFGKSDHGADVFRVCEDPARYAPGSKTEAFCESIAKTGKSCMKFDDPKTVNLKLAGFVAFHL
ncbi:MAG: hypothetical protein V2A34_08170, partial [Lentisphaerota bacterium]